MIAPRRLVRDLMAHDAFGAAASIAFWFFLSLVPLLVLVGFLVGHVARARGIDALLGPLLDVIPGSAEPLVGKELERLARAGAPSIAPVGFAGFMWTASSGLHNLMDVLETVVGARRRAWWKQRTIALAWVIAGLCAATALAAVMVKVDAYMQRGETAAEAPSAVQASPPPPPPRALARASRAQVRSAAPPAAAPARPRGNLRRRVHKALHAPGLQVVATALLLVAGTALLAAFYRFAAERRRAVARRTLPGAIAAVASWLAVSWAFGEYAVSIADYALYYGGLAAVAILMVWLYLTSLSLVVGAEVNAQLEGLRR